MSSALLPGVHPLSHDPTAAWEQLSQTQKVMRFKVKTPREPPAKGKVRVVCISDTHSLTPQLKYPIPPGDILIHAGDFTRCGHLGEVRQFDRWLSHLPHKHKIVVAGNHELSFDPGFAKPGTDALSSPRATHLRPAELGQAQPDPRIPGLNVDADVMQEAMKTDRNVRQELQSCIYLQDSGTTVMGLRIYGTPWQPEHCGWAFNLARGSACQQKWRQIPSGTDILITHTPPVGFGDRCTTGVRAGCVELLAEVQQRITPKYHVYGHIHEGYGVRSDGKTVFINASSCDGNFMPNNKPIVFDILPSEICT